MIIFGSVSWRRVSEDLLSANLCNQVAAAVPFQSPTAFGDAKTASGHVPKAVPTFVDGTVSNVDGTALEELGLTQRTPTTPEKNLMKSSISRFLCMY